MDADDLVQEVTGFLEQEMIALGTASAASGFFQGFPISSSSSRTPVPEQAGAKTQLTGIVGAAAIALMLLFVPHLAQDLPSSALAAVVIAASLSLVEVAGSASCGACARPSSRSRSCACSGWRSSG